MKIDGPPEMTAGEKEVLKRLLVPVVQSIRQLIAGKAISLPFIYVLPCGCSWTVTEDPTDAADHIRFTMREDSGCYLDPRRKPAAEAKPKFVN